MTFRFSVKDFFSIQARSPRLSRTLDQPSMLTTSSTGVPASITNKGFDLTEGASNIGAGSATER
jgi:hypothetical protein